MYESSSGICDPVKTLGKCKPTNACTDDQMESRKEAGKFCSSFDWICTKNKTGCNGNGTNGKTSALKDCDQEADKICQWL